MKALIVSPTPFDPPTAGNRRLIKNRVEALKSQGWTIDFVYVAMEGLIQGPDSSSLVDRFFIVPFDWPAKKDPVLIDIDWLTHGLNLPEEVIHTNYDLLLINYIFCSFAARQASATTIALETHDRFANRHEILASNGMRPSWIAATVPAEAEAISRADLILVLRDDDRAYFEALGDRTVMMLRHSESLRAAWPDEEAWSEKPPHFGFVGSSNVVNKKSLQSLLEAMRRAGTRAQHLRLHVFGEICEDVPQSDRDLCHLHGIVHDDAALYQEFDILVNPIFVGTGMKIKTVEALAHAKPVLCSPEGAAGFPHLCQYMKASSIDEIVDHMVVISENKFERANILNSSREVFSEYTKSAQFDFNSFLSYIEQNAAQHKSPPSTATIRWHQELAPDGPIPPASIWDLLRAGAMEAAELVAIETLALQPLAYPVYLAAAVTAELSGDTRRSERLLDVYLRAMEHSLPPPAIDVPSIAHLLTQRPFTRGAETEAPRRYLDVLVRALTATGEAACELRADLRAMMSKQAMLSDGRHEAGAGSTDESLGRLDEERSAGDASAGFADPGHDPFEAGEAARPAPLAPTGLPEPGLTVVFAAPHKAIPGICEELEIECSGSLPGIATTLPPIFLKFVRFMGRWLLQIDPNASPNVFVSASSAWHAGEWGLTFKLPLDKDFSSNINSKLDPYDAKLIAHLLEGIRKDIASREMQPDKVVADLLRALSDAKSLMIQ